MTWSERKLERTTMHVEAIYRFQAFVYSEWTASIDALIITRTGSTDAFVPIQSLLFPMFVCDRWIRCRSHRQRSLQREEKDDQMVIFVIDVSVFHFLFFLERSVIVNLLVWIVVRGYVRWLSQLGNCSSFELRNLSKSYFKEVMFVEIKMIRIIIESCSVYEETRV